MASFRRNLPSRALARRILNAVTLLAYTACAIGFPVPEISAAPHACGQRICGCATAETCQSGGCCCKPATAPSEESLPRCCKPKNQDHRPAKEPSANKAKLPRWLIGISAQKCRGGASLWIAADVALPGPLPTDWRPSWPFCFSFSVPHQSSLTLAADPSDPPPRSEAV